MSKTVEEPVTTAETPSTAPTGKAAFAAARAEVAAQSDEDQGDASEKPPAGDDTSPTKPAEDPDKVADQPTEPTDDPDALLTPDEVKKLSPKERGLYEKAQKNYTLKTQKLAEQRKEFDEWKPLMAALKADPMQAMETLAKQMGLKVTKADTQDTTTVTTTTATTLAQLPEGYEFLKPALEPLFDQYGKTLLAQVRSELAPIKGAMDESTSKAVAAETEATIEKFTAKYPGWEKHQAKMLEIGQKFVPTAGAMSDGEYMETLYKLATFELSKADQTKETVRRINKSVTAVESTTSGVSESRVEQTMPADRDKMTNKEWMAVCHDAASRGIVFKK